MGERERVVWWVMGWGRGKDRRIRLATSLQALGAKEALRWGEESGEGWFGLGGGKLGSTTWSVCCAGVCSRQSKPGGVRLALNRREDWDAWSAGTRSHGTTKLQAALPAVLRQQHGGRLARLHKRRQAVGPVLGLS